MEKPQEWNKSELTSFLESKGFEISMKKLNQLKVLITETVSKSSNNGISLFPLEVRK